MADQPFNADDYLTGDAAGAPSFNADDYLSKPAPKYGSFEVLADGRRVPVGSPEALAAHDPTSGQSFLTNAMAGAGKAQVDLYHGIKQLLGVDKDQTQQDIDEAKRLDAPLMNTGAGLTGYAGGAIADMAMPLGGLSRAATARGLFLAKNATTAADVANAARMVNAGKNIARIAAPTTLTGAAASGAAQGVLQPVATGESRGANTVLGAALAPAGNLAARGAGVVGNAVMQKAGVAANAAVKALTDAGVPLDAAQRTGSMLWNRAKIMLGDNPMTAGAQAEFKDLQQKSLNKAFLSTVGETQANAATPDVMHGVMSRLDTNYDNAAASLHVKYDDVEQPLSDLVDRSRLILNDQQYATVKRNAYDILDKAAKNGGIIDGAQYQNIKKTLTGLSGSADTDVAEFGRDMREVINDGLLTAAKTSGRTSMVDLLQKTNQQWRNMRTIEGAIDKTGNGDISPSRVANIMGQKANRSVSVYGHGDTALSDLAKAANNLLPEKMANSGTTARLMAQAMPAAIGAGVGAVAGGDWKTAGKGLAVGLLAPKAAQKLLNARSGQKIVDALGGLSGHLDMNAYLSGAAQHGPLATLFGGRPPPIEMRNQGPVKTEAEEQE